MGCRGKRRYLDFFGGVLTTMIGHAEPSVVAAVQDQAAKVMHTSTLYLSEPMIAFAEDVARVSGIDDARVFFTPSGSEANDAALLMATVHRGSNQILAMRNSYHGRTFSAQAITAHRSWSSRPASPDSTSPLSRAATGCAARSATSTTTHTPQRASTTSCSSST